MSYNGWKNYKTWNIALWFQNDEGRYNFAREYIKHHPEGTYEDIAELLSGECNVHATPDNVSYTDSGLDTEALTEMLKEL